MNFDDQDKQSGHERLPVARGLLARALEQARSLFHHFLVGSRITDCLTSCPSSAWARPAVQFCVTQGEAAREERTVPSWSLGPRGFFAWGLGARD
jgi:hypothetical protein